MYKEITTVEAAFKKLNIDPATKPSNPNLSKEFSNVLDRTYDLMIISKAIRSGWEPDYNDSNQRKYEPWFDLEVWERNPSGFRFYVSYCTFANSSSVLGPLLCQESAEKSDFLGKTFESLFREIMKP